MRKVSLLALLGLIVLAGCAGLAGPGGMATSSGVETVTVTERSPTPTPTVTEQSPTPTAYVPPDATAGNTVAYENLTDEQQAAADAARYRRVQFVPDSPAINESEGYDEDIVDPFRENRYLRNGDRYYEIRHTRAGLYASYDVSASPNDPGPNATVVPIENFSASVRSVVRSAIEEGEHRTPLGKWHSLPESLSKADYVRYENQTYRLGYGVGDYWAHQVRLRLQA